MRTNEKPTETKKPQTWQKKKDTGWSYRQGDHSAVQVNACDPLWSDGNILNKFGISKNLEFGNGVAVNDKEEIFMRDNGPHYVKVLNYQDVFLRPIGGEGMTN